jgi:periplasmic protein TonB
VDSQPRHLTPAVAVSVAVHASVIVAILFFVSHPREKKTPNVTRLDPAKIVWIPDPRPASRGGGGAPAKPTPPPPTPAPAVSVPEPPKPMVVEEPPTIAPEPEPAPVNPPASAVATTGEATGPPSSTGIGNSPGPGAGNERGPGGGGDGVFPIGNGVSAPIPLRRPPPAYTAEAMRARLQGVVVLNCVVRPDGKCSDIRVLKSLDMMFGLDQQAVASAREWVFRPGMRMGQPVPVLVTLEIGFTIR